MIYENIGNRNTINIDAIDTQQSGNRSLARGGGLIANLARYLCGDIGGGFMARLN